MAPVPHNSVMSPDVVCKDVLLFHLKEARDGLNSIVILLEGERELESADLVADIGHVYHHMNSGWNARLRGDYFKNSNLDTFIEDREFPADIRPWLSLRDSKD